MTVIALPPGHDHLAHALVRDLGYVKVHVDAVVRASLIILDPLVESGAIMVNMGRSPRLVSRLEAHGGDWDKAMLRTPEMIRLVEMGRTLWPTPQYADKTVVVGVVGGLVGAVNVAIDGRGVGDHLVAEGSVPDQQTALVGFVRSLDDPPPLVAAAVAVADDPFD